MGCLELPIEYFAEAEEVIGNDYFGYRFYNMELGRWLTKDPIGDNGGVNLYCFIKNKTTNKYDYKGFLLTKA